MRVASLFTVLATAASLATAQYDTVSGTTTSTMTLTQTLTITKCKSDNPDCPAYSSTSAIYPVSNSTSHAGPTAYNSTTFVYPTGTGAPAPSKSAPVTTPKGTSAPSSPPTVPTAGAGSLVVQSGLLLGVLGAGVALLA